MKSADKKYFSKKLNEMADKFNQAALCTRPDIKAATGPAFEVDSELAKEANEFAAALYAEFKAAGYSDQDWGALEESSGAKKKLGQMGAPKT